MFHYKTVCLLWNSKEYILVNVGGHVARRSFTFRRIMKVIQIWDNMRASFSGEVLSAHNMYVCMCVKSFKILLNHYN